MYLEQIDIDVFDRHRRESVGPFAPGLNAVYAPGDTARNAVVNFIRAVMLDGHHWHSGVAGRVVWCDADGLIVCHREVDGSPRGRFFSERLARDGKSMRADELGFNRYHLPAEWLDAFVAPVGDAVTQCRRAIVAARRAGLDLKGRREENPEHTVLKQRWESLDREVTLHQGRGDWTVETVAHWESARSRLLEQLDRTPAEYDHRAYHRWLEDHRRAEGEWEAAKRELRRCEGERHDLLRSVATVREELSRLSPEPLVGDSSLALQETDRRQLDELDQRLVRWRRTLREIRQVREQIEERATDLRVSTEVVQGGLHAVAEPRRPLHALERQLDDARRRFDWLADRSNRDIDGSPEEAAHLADLLRSARDELNRICESLSHREAIDLARRTEEKRSQLERCEQEMLAAIEGLITQRAELLRRLADTYRIPAAQLATAFGDWCRCDDHPHLSQWLLSGSCPSSPRDNEVYWSRRRRMEGELADLEAELVRGEDRIETARRGERHWQNEVERIAGHRPTIQDDRADRERWQAELAHVEACLAKARRWEDLIRERDRVAEKLRAMEPARYVAGRFCHEVSQWLYRLTAGRLRRFESYEGSSYDGEHRDRVDGRPIQELSPLDAHTTALAIRLAAAEGLRLQGRILPLVLEHLPGDIAHQVVQHGAHGAQLILVTNQRQIADDVAAVGGKVCHLEQRSLPAERQRVDTYRYAPRGSDLFDVNRKLDQAWRETYGVYDTYPRGRAEAPRSVRDDLYEVWIEPRDARYVETRYVDTRPIDPRSDAYAGTYRDARGEPDYYLHEESAVDQAPSVDAVVAARLRGLGIHRVGQLLAADPVLLADRLMLSGVTPREVRQWQDEARLVCRVRKLRAFDARVLVGCGVTDSHQLAAMHPTQLLERVQSFLATDRGRHILSSGSSYELSRITNWIVSANRSLRGRGDHPRHADRRPDDFGGLRNPNGRSLYDELTHPHDRVPVARRAVRFRRDHDVRVNDRDASREPRPVRTYRPERLRPEPSPLDRLRNERRDKDRPETLRTPMPAADREQRRNRRPLDPSPIARPPVAGNDRHRGDKRNKAKPLANAPVDNPLRFFLSRRDPVVDAPTIGPKLVDKLEAAGVRTVGDLLDINPNQLADRLNLPRVTGETVRTWQLQAALVCRVPELRGHDAQLLVAAGIQTPEQLAAAQAGTVLDRVLAIARSAEGKRFLRGNPAPDLTEVEQWLRWAQHSRSLMAA